MCFLPNFWWKSFNLWYYDELTLLNHEILWGYTFSCRISFLVSCSCFCSLSSTEDLAGLPRNLSFDWLNLILNTRQLFFVGWVRKSTEASFFYFFASFPRSYLAECWEEKLVQGSFPHSLLPTHQQKQQRIGRKKTAKFKRRAEWAELYRKMLEKNELWVINKGRVVVPLKMLKFGKNYIYNVGV